MKTRTREGILGAARMVALQWASGPGLAFDYVAGLANAVDPDAVNFHPRRLAYEAAEDAVAALFVASLDGGVSCLSN